MTWPPQDSPSKAPPPDPHAHSTAPAQPSPPLPYAAPARQVLAAELYRNGDSLIVTNGATLPARCVLCGAAGWRTPVRLNFTWDASFQMTKLASLQLRQKGSVHAHLCKVHRRTWNSGRLCGALGAAVSIPVMLAGMLMGIYSESTAVPAYTPLAIVLMLCGFAILICSMFFFTLRTRTLTCSRIQDGYLYLEGAAHAFLDDLAPLATFHAGGCDDGAERKA